MIMLKEKGECSAGQDTSGDDHPINIARKILNLGYPLSVRFWDGAVVDIPCEIAGYIMSYYMMLDKPSQKEQMIFQIWSSERGMADYLVGVKYPMDSLIHLKPKATV
jgi:hypothetical protein